MSENTIDPNMPLKDTGSPTDELSESAVRVRLLAEDDEKLKEIVANTKQVLRSITIQEVLRDAVHYGLPTVEHKLQAACAAAKKAS